jgi:2-polyprenyl-3-methyl-5-hydroxy-6-metoxy-1,4-benzoquinol methylase
MLPHRARFAAAHERLLDLLEEHQPSRGALLEVGSAFGWFLDAARARGWRVSGIEAAPAPAGVRSAESEACTHTGTVEEAPLAGPYDAIVLVQVIEHLADPRAVLEALVAALAPRGVIFIETPNLAGLSARLHIPRWEAINLGRGHWHLFDADTLARMCSRVGLEVLDVRTYHKGLTLKHARQALAGVNRALDAFGLGNNVAVLARGPSGIEQHTPERSGAEHA